MDQPFAHTLSFDDLEVLVLVENGGATPREVADSLGIDLEETKALFSTWCGAVCSLARRNPPPSCSPPWPAACGTMKPYAPRLSRLLSLGRGPKTKAETGKPPCSRPCERPGSRAAHLPGRPPPRRNPPPLRPARGGGPLTHSPRQGPGNADAAETLDQQVQSRQPLPCR
jgi:hypothetical protein